MRSGGWCEIRLPGCWGHAVDPAHRIGTKAGGRHGAAKETHGRLSNIMHACRACHDWCHHNPAEAGKLGLMLGEGRNPATEPVQRRGVRVYLRDDGTMSQDPPDKEEAEVT